MTPTPLRLHAWTATCGALLLAAAPAQDAEDRRDRVVLKSGKEIEGRVWDRYQPDEVVVLQGGRRIRVPRASIRDVHTVDDDLRAFFEHREASEANIRRAWFVAEWAASKELPGMARAQALSVLLKEPDHAEAHAYLGHRQQGKTWRYKVGDRFVSRAAFDEHYGNWGTALTLRGEHFVVKTDAGLQRALDMLFDLERFYLFFMDTFGPAVQARTALDPITVEARGNAQDFSAISARKLPYFDLRGDRVHTFFQADARRPEHLFAVATQALLYRCIAAMRPAQSRAHLCAWAEIGLGQWAESAFGGKPGKAAPQKKVVLDTLIASAVLRTRPKLKRVTHLQYDLFHELSPRVNFRWDASTALAHYLMSGTPDPKIRERFLQFLHIAFRKGLGDSSTAFDKAMGMRVEQLERHFFRWLQVKN